MKYHLNNIVIGIVFLFLVFSCTSKKENAKAKNDQFSWVTFNDDVPIMEYIEKFPIKITIEEDDINTKIPLNEFIEKYQIIKLTNQKDGFIGDIDKIIFNDSLIFILDIYLNNSLQVFDLTTGLEKFTIRPLGEGPGHAKTIYDFAIDNDNIFIHDGGQAKILKYDFNGNYISETKIPVRLSSFRKNQNEWVLSSINEVNDHILSIADKNLIMLDSQFNPIRSFKYPKVNLSQSNFFPRDVLRENYGEISYFPRYASEVLKLNSQNNTLSSLIKIKLGKYGVPEDELQKTNSDFISNRKEDGKYFGFGHHFISKKWIGVQFDRFGGNNLYLLYNRLDEKAYKGTGFKFDIQGLPFFSFPISCYNEKCISVISMQQFRNLDVDKLLLDQNVDSKKIMDLKNMLKSIDDFEQPILLLFELK